MLYYNQVICTSGLQVIAPFPVLPYMGCCRVHGEWNDWPRKSYVRRWNRSVTLYHGKVISNSGVQVLFVFPVFPSVMYSRVHQKWNGRPTKPIIGFWSTLQRTIIKLFLLPVLQVITPYPVFPNVGHCRVHGQWNDWPRNPPKRCWYRSPKLNRWKVTSIYGSIAIH